MKITRYSATKLAPLWMKLVEYRVEAEWRGMTLTHKIVESDIIPEDYVIDSLQKGLVEMMSYKLIEEIKSLRNVEK